MNNQHKLLSILEVLILAAGSQFHMVVLMMLMRRYFKLNERGRSHFLLTAKTAWGKHQLDKTTTCRPLL